MSEFTGQLGSAPLGTLQFGGLLAPEEVIERFAVLPSVLALVNYKPTNALAKPHRQSTLRPARTSTLVGRRPLTTLTSFKVGTTLATVKTKSEPVVRHRRVLIYGH